MVSVQVRCELFFFYVLRKTAIRKSTVCPVKFFPPKNSVYLFLTWTVLNDVTEWDFAGKSSRQTKIPLLGHATIGIVGKNGFCPTIRYGSKKLSADSVDHVEVVYRTTHTQNTLIDCDYTMNHGGRRCTTATIVPHPRLRCAQTLANRLCNNAT